MKKQTVLIDDLILLKRIINFYKRKWGTHGLLIFKDTEHQENFEKI